jgi:hypothetical protein
MSYGGRIEAFFTVPSATTIAATNSGGTGTAVSLTAGNYTPTSYCAHLQSRLNAVRAPATWTVSLSTGPSGTGKVTIDCVGETWAITWTTAAAGTVIGYAGNIASTSDPAVSDYNARGLWLPGCPLHLAGDPDRAPKVTDNRSSESPTGGSITLGGNKKYVHKNLRWSHVTRARMFEGSASTTYSSLQQWFDDTQFGDGHTWFARGSAFQAYWDNAGSDRILGYDLNAGAGPTNGWKLSPALDRFEPQKVSEGWIGMWSFVFPRLASEG